jgi:hypothetical protein
MQQETPDEFKSRDSHLFNPVMILIIPPGESNIAAWVNSYDPLVRNSDSVGVPIMSNLT